MTKGIRVGTVAYGKGLFANRRFVRGDRVAEVHGRIIDDPEYGSDYCIDLGGSLSLEPRAPYRYVNHSCSPNCRLYVEDRLDSDGRPRVALYALRTIDQDDQLTIDYSWPADSAIPCECDSPRCRGWIVARAELKHLSQTDARRRANGLLARSDL